MPALPNVPNVLRCRLLFDMGGKLDQGLRFFLQYSGTAPNVATLTTLAGDITTAFSGSGKPQSVMNAVNELTGVILEDLTSPTSAAVTVPEAVSGSVVTAALPSDVCVLSGYLIARRYRGGHPRTYWPLGSAADLTTPQAWSSAALTSFLDAVETFYSDIVGTTISGMTIGAHVNISYYEGFTSVENPITHRWRNVPDLRAAPLIDPITGYDIAQFPGSQRRRRTT